MHESPRHVAPPGYGGPLTGVRLIDLTWLLVGAGATRLLATLGAEVIRLEAPAPGRLDPLRRRPPSLFTPPVAQEDPEEVVLLLDQPRDRSAHFFNINPGKRSITLNMNHPQGRKLFARLVPLGDVVTENFSSRQMERWGFGYQRLRQLKADIIYVQMSGLGFHGRDHPYITFGPTAQALAGLRYQSGLPEPHPPAGWGLSYLDHMGAYYGAMAVLCGLYHRQQTGRGQHIDWKFSLTPAHVGGPLQRGASCLGEDNAYVYGELLGLSAEELARYRAEGVI